MQVTTQQRPWPAFEAKEFLDARRNKRKTAKAITTTTMPQACQITYPDTKPHMCAPKNARLVGLFGDLKGVVLVALSASFY